MHFFLRILAGRRFGRKTGANQHNAGCFKFTKSIELSRGVFYAFSNNAAGLFEHGRCLIAFESTSCDCCLRPYRYHHAANNDVETNLECNEHCVDTCKCSFSKQPKMLFGKAIPASLTYQGDMKHHGKDHCGRLLSGTVVAATVLQNP